MKSLTWFTHTNIDTRRVSQQIDYFPESTSVNLPTVSFDLTEFIKVFKENEIWKRKKYRSEYNSDFDSVDFEKIKSVTIHLHSNNILYSKYHNYENVFCNYINLDNLEKSKITSSGISEAFQIAVVVVKFDSDRSFSQTLSNSDETDYEGYLDKIFSDEAFDSNLELNKIKSIVCEFVQFFSFNLHLNFPTSNYESYFADKPRLIGFTAISESDSVYYQTDKINFFAHYVLFEEEHNKLYELMRITSKFWHKEIPSIHFFLDALQGDFITATNFIKLVFTVESFFSKNTSNDFITLVLPLVLCKNTKTMKAYREILKKSFHQRNEIVHGNRIFGMSQNFNSKDYSKNMSILFFELKNLIIYLFHFYLNEDLFNSKVNEKINHEFIFRYFPNGIN